MPERETILGWYFNEDGIPTALGRFGTKYVVGVDQYVPPPSPGVLNVLQKVTASFNLDLAKGTSQPVAACKADVYYVDAEDLPGGTKTFIILKGTIIGASAGGGDVAVGYRAWLPSWLNPTDKEKIFTGHAHLWIDGGAGYTGTAKFTTRDGTEPHIVFEFNHAEWEFKRPVSWLGKKMHCTFTIIYERDADG